MLATAARPLRTLLVAVACSPCAIAHAQETPAAAPATTTATPTGATPPTAPPATARGGGAGASDRREAARQNAEKRLRDAVVPAPMTPERFAAFLAAVDPALAANADLAAAFATYRDETRTAIEASAGKIADRLPAAYRFDAAQEEFVTRPNPELMQVLALRDKATARILAAERALLRTVAVATPAERKLRFVEERLAWIDERTPREGLLSSTRLTLLEILARAQVAPESWAAVEPLLVAHADRLAGLREARNAMLREGDARRAEIETRAGTLWRLGPADAVRATEAELAKVDDDEFASEIAVRELHFDTLAKLRARLGSREGRRLVEEWQRSVHPELFDDERMLARLVESSLALPSSSADIDAAILDAVDTAYRRLEPLARDASNAADLVLPRLLDRSDESVLAEIASRQAVLAIQARRRAAIRDLVAQVRTIAAPSDEQAVARFSGMTETLAALERADAHDRASLDALAAAIVARAAEASAPAAGSETAAPEISTPAAAPNPNAPAATAPTARPRTPDSRPSGGAESTPNGGNRSGRGSRRQQGPTGGGQ